MLLLGIAQLKRVFVYRLREIWRRGLNEFEGRDDSPPKLGGVAAPSRKCREATERGADGVVPLQNPERNSFGTTPPARPFLEFDGLAGTPPNLGVELSNARLPIHSHLQRRRVLCPVMKLQNQ